MRRRAFTVLLVAVVVALTACTAERSSNPADPASVAPAMPAVAEVAVSDVTGVLTLGGTVAQGAAFNVHADVRGVVIAVEESGVTVRKEGTNAVVEIAAPEGTRREATLVQVNDVVTPGMAVIAVHATGFSVQAALDQADLLRFVSPPLSARAQVKGGSAPFDCSFWDDTPTSVGEEGGAVIVCRIPDDAIVLAGMEVTLVIQLEHVDDALVLPVEAVAGTVDNGSVYLVDDDGEAIETPVVLGTTDGVRIVIAEGLREGDLVYIPGPGFE